MKTIKDKTMITISRVTREFVREMNVFENMKENICKGYKKN